MNDFLAINTIEYLYSLLENTCGALNIGYELSSEEYLEMEKSVYNSCITNLIRLVFWNVC